VFVSGGFQSASSAKTLANTTSKPNALCCVFELSMCFLQRVGGRREDYWT